MVTVRPNRSHSLVLSGIRWQRLGTGGCVVAATGSLGTAIRARLDQLGLPARRFTAAGYISAATLSRVFAGQESLRDPSRVAELERGLGWRPGSVNAVLTGKAPTTIEVRAWPNVDSDWRRAVETAWREADDDPAPRPGRPTDLVDPDRTAELVDFLFHTVRASGEGERTYDDVAEEMARSGRSLTSSDLQDLRTGARTLLDRRDAQALAGVFGVPTSYFFDPVDAERVMRQLTAVAALRDAGVERVALRFAGLSEDDRRTAEALIEHLRSAGNGLA